MSYSDAGGLSCLEPLAWTWVCCGRGGFIFDYSAVAKNKDILVSLNVILLVDGTFNSTDIKQFSTNPGEEGKARLCWVPRASGGSFRKMSNVNANVNVNVNVSNEGLTGWLLSNWLPRLSEKLSQCLFFISCIKRFCNLSSFILIKSQSVMRFHGIWTKEGGHLRRFSCDTDSDSDMRIMWLVLK